MAKRMDLNRRTFLVLSGSSNPLGQSLALEFGRRLAPGSLALILDEDQEQLRELENHLQGELKTKNVQVMTGRLDKSHSNGVQLMEETLKDHFEAQRDTQRFERSVIVHNEGQAATHVLVEPQGVEEWKDYVQHQLYAPVALNQMWLQSKYLEKVEKLAVNVTSSLLVRPLVYSGLLCSCKQARDMYFRAMASEEYRFGVQVLSFSPGLMATHESQCDVNGNRINPVDLVASKQTVQLPRIQPRQATLKLINILEEISFVSGHDVDYYDTFVL